MKTIIIGTQTWMAKNLNIGVYQASGIAGYDHSDVTNNSIIEKYAYDNDTTNFATYGGLYDWGEAMGYDATEGVQGICPLDWHIPTDAEWETLVNYVGGSSTGGTALKEGGSSGFQALISGWRSHDGSFGGISYYSAIFWSSSQYDTAHAWSREVVSGGYTEVNRHDSYKIRGFCVRCIKD